MGPISIGSLKPGEYRPLRSEEVRAIYKAVGLGSDDAPLMGRKG